MIAKIQTGAVLNPRELVTIQSGRIQVPDSQRIVHLQFRRFAGCPVCNLHLHSFVRRHEEIEAASIREVVVFHSTADLLLPHAGNLPFAVIADPDKRLYAEFGVESALRALLDPRVWVPVLRAVSRSALMILQKQQPVPSLNPQGGRFGFTGRLSDRARRPRAGLQVRLARVRPVVSRRASRSGGCGTSGSSNRQPASRPPRHIPIVRRKRTKDEQR